MKKILTAIAALAMVAGLASCQKENVIDNGGSNKTTITARFADTKVSYSESGNDLKPSWESGDKVLGLTSGGETFTLEVTSISGNVATLQGSDVPEGSVRLIYVSGISSAKYDSVNKKYVISYNCQKGDKTMPAIMTADGTIDHGCGEFIFDNNGAVLGLYSVGTALSGKTLKQVTLYGTDIASKAEITYGGVTPVYANNGYNVISTKILEGITVAANGDLNENILMAVPAGAEVEKVFIRTTEGEVYTMAATNVNAMDAGLYRFIHSDNANFVRDADRDNMILTGVFSTDESEENQVFFSKGNLWSVVAESTTFNFEDEQYEFHGYDSQTDTWGLFGWSTEATHYGKSKSETTTDYQGSFKDWGEAIGDGNIWSTPSNNNWEILAAVDANEGDFRYGFTKPAVTVCGKTNSIVIAPDGWDLTANPLQAVYNSTSTPMTWEEAEAAGLVCLPAAGSRKGVVVNADEIGVCGYYWSSDFHNTTRSYYVSFDSEGVYTAQDYRKNGFSVRLVSECK